MKRILYVTNTQVPYRVRFFDLLSKHCDLTVLYERDKSTNRDDTWAKSEKGSFRAEYLKGVRIGGENAFSFGILRHVFGRYDAIILGCYNSPSQMLAMLVMRLCRVPYYLNLDGEIFAEGNGAKARLKQFFLRGASGYLVAGERAAESLRRVIGDSDVRITAYGFSSLSEAELVENRKMPESRGEIILVVGQRFEYKGMDVAAEVARADSDHRYKFVGMGKNADRFAEEQGLNRLDHVEVIPFLQKHELNEEYRSCSMLLLPSRQECWGLVINEAASFGAPIVSTWGSGAAVEFIADRYPQYLAKPGDADSLRKAIQRLDNAPDRVAYSRHLVEKSSNYSIERSVYEHLRLLGIEERCSV